MIIDKEKILTRLNHLTRFENKCWLYTGHLNRKGYGVLNLKNPIITITVSRLSAYIFLGLDVDNKKLHSLHKSICPNKNCWNPEHLYIGTNQDNMNDMKKARLYCKRGHEFNPNNTVILWSAAKGYQRTCKKCKKEASKVNRKLNRERKKPAKILEGR